MTDIPLDPEPIAGASSGLSFETIAAIVIGVIVVIAFIVIAIVARKILRRPELHGLTRERVKAKWIEIEQLSASGSMGAKMAIVEADKLLDGVLKSMMMHGETLGERLKFAGYKYPELRNVWPAHRLRNQIVHESTFSVSERHARAALHDYEKALKSIGVL
jgi:hypothetical protein